METYTGVDIHYNKATSKFEALVGRKVIRRSGIQALRKEIDKRSERKVTLMDAHGYPVVVVGKTREGSWRREDGELIYRYGLLYELDEDLARQIKQLEAAREEFEQACHMRYEYLRSRLVYVDDLPPLPEPDPEPEIPAIGGMVMARRRIK